MRGHGVGLGVALAAVALLTSCGRDETRTVVLSGPRPEASAPGPLPPASAVAAAEPRSTPAPSVLPKLPGLAKGPSYPELARSEGDGPALLAARAPLIPVQGVPPRALADTFDQDRGGRRHEAIDIAAPRGTPVVAVDDGRLVKLFTSVPGGLTVYQFDRDGNLAYYYAHLDRYADGLKEGMDLRRGDVLGYVGSSGNASPQTPHLHFAVFRLGPQRLWWKGDPVNPYPVLARSGASR